MFEITLKICQESRGSKVLKVSTVSYSMVKAACDGLRSSIYGVNMEGTCGGSEKTGMPCISLAITWKNKIPY